MLRFLGSLVAAAIVAGPSVVATKPDISVAAAPTVDCVYHLLKSSDAVRWVDVYAIDGVRSAVEFRFRSKVGKAIVADVLLLTIENQQPTYGIGVPLDESDEAGFESSEFASGLQLASKCHLQGGFDNLYPRPAPRTKWRRIDWR